MILAHGTDWLESARLVLRRIAPDDLPFFTRIHAPPEVGRCGLMDLVVESGTPEHGIRRGWFGREQAPAGVALTFECELGYTFDPAVWGQGFATEAARCVRDYARDVLRWSYAISAILPQNARSRRVAERSGARAAGQMEVIGLTWDRYVWPLATGGPTQRQPDP